MTTEIGELQERHGARGGASYSREVYHRGLHKHRVIKGPDVQVIQAKVRLQVAEWEALWNKRQQVERRTTLASQAKEARRAHLEQCKEEASARTAEAQQFHQSLQGTLVATLSRNDAIDWDQLKDRSPFSVPAPKKPKAEPIPQPAAVPPPPERNSSRYQPYLGLLDMLISSRRQRKEAEVQQQFATDTRAWEREHDRIVAENEAQLEAHRRSEAERQADHERAKQVWQAERDAFLAKQAEQQAAIDAFRARYESREPAAMVEYCDMVLGNSDYPACVTVQPPCRKSWTFRV